MKVLIISPCDLPVPAVKGGAVASLMESILKVNEKKKKLDITIVSSWNKDAQRVSSKYINTKFLWIKIPDLCVVMDKVCENVVTLVKKKGSSKEYARKLYVISRLKKHLSKNDYDIIVVQNSGYLLKVFKTRDISKKYLEKIYYHLHNDIPTNADDSVLQNTKFILISKYLLKGVTDKCGSNAEKRSVVVKNGIDYFKFMQEISENEKIEIKTRLSISEDKKVLVFVGRIVEEKGIKELLNAISQIKDPSVMLLVIGSTNFGLKEKSNFECEIEKKCIELGDRVRFTGFIHNDELWKYYKIGDVAVLPSKWEEPAGLTMIEAAASGLPVITTNSGGIPEYLNNDYAIFVNKEENFSQNLYNAINYVLDNLDEWKKKGKMASEYVKENFSEDVFYENFVKSLE